MNNYFGYRSLVIMHIYPTGPAPNPIPNLVSNPTLHLVPDLAPDPTRNPAPKPTLVPALLRMRIIDSHTSGSLQSIWKHRFSF